MSNFKIAIKDDVKNAGFVFVKDVNTQEVKKIATSADFQVGLSNLPKDLTVTGKAIFTQGISGSLTRLIDNTSYLVAGSNITITSASNGQVTIATTGASTGDVAGPASAIDNTIARFDSTTGKLIQGSGVVIDDSNNITTAGDFAVNGGDLTSSATTFNLLNSTVTTLNIGGAATTLEIGAATGTTSINNALTVDGNTTLGNATSDTVTINGTTTFAGSAVTTTFNGDIAVDGGDITTTAPTMNLVNAATTINLGSTAVTRTTNIATGAAVQTVTLGSTSGASSLTLNAGSSGITMSSTSTTSADVTIGNIEIGQWPYTTSYCMIGHSTLNHTAVGNYAVLQSSTGDTYLNASSTKALAFRINNVDSGYINASTISLTGGSGVATTVTLGSTSGGSTLTLDAGSGDINIGTAQFSRTTTIGPINTNIASAITHTVNIGYIPSHASAITNVNIGTAGAGSTKNVITIGNYSSTVASTTAIYGDELTLGTSGKKIGFFGTSPIIKPTIGGSNFTANAGTAMNSASTSTGGSGASAYTFAGIVRALKDLGLITV